MRNQFPKQAWGDDVTTFSSESTMNMLVSIIKYQLNI